LELLALVLINIVFGVILYYSVSIKVTNSVRDYQIVKLKKEIQAHTLSFFKESESYLALMDSRIAVLKNLLHKAETMGIDFQNLPSQEKANIINSSFKETEPPIPNKPSSPKYDAQMEPVSREPKIKSKPVVAKLPENDSSEEGFFGGLIAGLGKGLKSMFGVNDEIFINTENEPSPKAKKNSVIDVSIGGNPLDADDVLKDNLNADESFQTVFNAVNNPYLQNSKPQDSVSISIATALEELPSDVTKVEKVVHLLKKGYSHSDISEEMGLAIPEISLIETIKIERSRRV
jgi:hypothetical protein